MKTSIYLPEDLADRLRALVAERGWEWKPSTVIQNLVRERLATPGEEIPQPSKLMTSEKKLVDRIFDLLEGNHQTVLLLAQAGQERRGVIDAIKAQAQHRDKTTSVRHIAPPSSPDASPEQYFDRLGRQCAFKETVRGSAEWEDNLDRRLSRGERIFLLASSFENGADDRRRTVAGVLRSLSERYSPRLKVLLCGGERLAALKYEVGALSMLNDAEQVNWPALTAQDVLEWQEHEFPDAGVDQDKASEILELSGGHPRLVRHCLQMRQDTADPQLVEDGQELDISGVVWQLFTPYRNHKERERLLKLLNQEEQLAPFAPWPADSLLRKLFWSNLLVERKKGFWWRCEVLRQVGRKVLECADTES